MLITIAIIDIIIIISINMIITIVIMLICIIITTIIISIIIIVIMNIMIDGNGHGRRGLHPGAQLAGEEPELRGHPATIILIYNVIML